jgi:nicotinamidase/pyrazinamidase
MKHYLIIVDVQNDFSQKKGSLFVKGSELAIKNINKLLKNNKYDKIIATQDFHPLNHISFASTHQKDLFSTIEVDYGNQMLWPDHCIKNTWGSQIDDRLNSEQIEVIWRKGTKEYLDSYSAFLENDNDTETGLSAFINYDGGFNCFVDIVGIATDVCVYNTAKDCYNMITDNVRVFLPCCAGVTPKGVEKAIIDMKSIGIVIEEDIK